MTRIGLEQFLTLLIIEGTIETSRLISYFGLENQPRLAFRVVDIAKLAAPGLIIQKHHFSLAFVIWTGVVEKLLLVFDISDIDEAVVIYFLGSVIKTRKSTDR